ncbi:hypothetical protein ACQSSU_06585 [Micromonospora echinospora]
MAWTAPMTAVANSVFTAAQFNTHVRDNLNETAPAKATVPGRVFVATGLNAIAERAVGNATINTQESTSSNAFVDLATAGPSVSLTTGQTVIVILSAALFNTSAGQTAQMSVQVTGASSVAPSVNLALIYESGAAGDLVQGSYAFPISGLTAGTNTFTAKYRADAAGTATFLRRQIVVLPFG